VQVAADRVPPVAVAEHLAQPVGLAQPGGGTEDVADRDRAAEHGGGVLAHRVVGERDEVVVPGEDLRPVGLRGAGRVVVQGGDGGLDLVAPGALDGQRGLQDAHALGDLAGVPQATVLPVERDDATL
jgi:CubicO group peptidase (beta-lactamase class C family)